MTRQLDQEVNYNNWKVTMIESNQYSKDKWDISRRSHGKEEKWVKVYFNLLSIKRFLR